MAKSRGRINWGGGWIPPPPLLPTRSPVGLAQNEWENVGWLYPHYGFRTVQKFCIRSCRKSGYTLRTFAIFLDIGLMAMMAPWQLVTQRMIDTYTKAVTHPNTNRNQCALVVKTHMRKPGMAEASVLLVFGFMGGEFFFQENRSWDSRLLSQAKKNSP